MITEWEAERWQRVSRTLVQEGQGSRRFGSTPSCPPRYQRSSSIARGAARAVCSRVECGVGVRDQEGLEGAARLVRPLTRPGMLDRRCTCWARGRSRGSNLRIVDGIGAEVGIGRLAIEVAGASRAEG